MRPSKIFQRLLLVLGTCSLLIQGSAVFAQTMPLQPISVENNQHELNAAASRDKTTDSTPDLHYTLKSLGALQPIRLRGVDGLDVYELNIPLDQVVTEANLDMQYAYSPSFITHLSHINVIINDEVAYSVPVPKEDAGVNLQRTISIPAHLITEDNTVKFQLIGHYTEECEDPLHSSLWANISNLSQFNLTTAPIRLENDLSLFPLPFFDKRLKQDLTLPFVFEQTPDAAALEASGIIASMFGSMAGQLKADFPVLLMGDYPRQGHAVVFSIGDQASQRLGREDGPSITIQSNPNDPFGKFLLVSGNNSQELKQAAQALALGQVTMTGSSISVKQLEELKPRVPYDAPNWVPVDRPVKLGELVSPGYLNVRGYEPDPIYIPMRVPSDLFAWRADPVPLQLKYQYTPQVGEVNSSLIINTGDELLRSIPLLSIDQLKQRGWTDTILADELRPSDMALEIPLDRLLNHSNINFQYLYEYVKEGECRGMITQNMRGSIDPDTTIDLSGYSHYIAMPNLQAFDKTGFPFTRMADLSETVVVLPEQPQSDEISAYLYLLGRFGQSTGYPAIKSRVAFANQGLDHGDKDLLVIVSDMQTWLSDWEDAMPVKLAGELKSFATSELANWPQQWLSPDPRENTRDKETIMRYRSDGESVVIAGFESPSQSKRAVVLVAADSASDLNQIRYAFDRGDKDSAAMRGSLVVVKEKAVHPVLAEFQYYLGHLHWKKRIEWELTKYWPSAPAIDRLLTWFAAAVIAVLALLLLIWWGRRRRRHL